MRSHAIRSRSKERARSRIDQETENATHPKKFILLLPLPLHNLPQLLLPPLLRWNDQHIAMQTRPTETEHRSKLPLRLRVRTTRHAMQVDDLWMEAEVHGVCVGGDEGLLKRGGEERGRVEGHDGGVGVGFI